MIYIVTDGTYSDYHIEAVFSELDKAEKYLAELKQMSNDDPRIEEWPVDIDQNKIAKEYWRTTINLVTGKITEGNNSMGWALPEQRVGNGSDMNEIPYKGTGYVPDVYFVSFVSREHANKLAIEARQEFLRKGI